MIQDNTLSWARHRGHSSGILSGGHSRSSPVQEKGLVILAEHCTLTQRPGAVWSNRDWHGIVVSYRDLRRSQDLVLTERAWLAAMAPKTKGSVTMALKKSMLCTRAWPAGGAGIRAASSEVSRSARAACVLLSPKACSLRRSRARLSVVEPTCSRLDSSCFWWMPQRPSSFSNSARYLKRLSTTLLENHQPHCR